MIPFQIRANKNFFLPKQFFTLSRHPTFQNKFYLGYHLLSQFNLSEISIFLEWSVSSVVSAWIGYHLIGLCSFR